MGRVSVGQWISNELVGLPGGGGGETSGLRGLRSTKIRGNDWILRNVAGKTARKVQSQTQDSLTSLESCIQSRDTQPLREGLPVALMAPKPRQWPMLPEESKSALGHER